MTSTSYSNVSLADVAIDKPESLWRYYALFFCSGFPALLYQIVWQRALFTIYGVNIESVTVIVSVFMLGLGLGSLAGGRLSTVPGIRPLRAFGLIELSIGVFGVCSLGIFHWAAHRMDSLISQSRGLSRQTVPGFAVRSFSSSPSSLRTRYPV